MSHTGPSTASKFWLSSLVMFFALRLADAINAFAGIYLVPKYVGAEELGAVLPLANFAGFLSLPVAIVSTVFMRQVALLAEEKAFGEIKSLVRGVFAASAAVLIAAIIGTRLFIGNFLERLRIEEGSLALLIVVSALSASLAPVYSNVLVALKRFKTLAILNVLSAPVRVVSMILLMPLRAISGYFAAQTTPHLFMAAGSIWAIRKRLSVKAAKFWTRRRLREVSVSAGVVALFMISTSFQGLLETTALRQCLSSHDSAAYYMVTRFSEIAAYAGGTLATVLFPFAASGAHGKTVRKIVALSALVSLAIGAALAAFFAVAGRWLLGVLPNGEIYSNYTPALVGMTVVSSMNAASLCMANFFVASGQRRWLLWWCALHIVYCAAFWANSRYGDWTLYAIIAAQAAYAIVRLVVCSLQLRVCSLQFAVCS